MSTRPASGSGAPFAWLRGDLHSHSRFSDGMHSVAELAAQARALGLDFLAVTDHNTDQHHADLAASGTDGLTPICGWEYTTPSGHMNVWGAPGRLNRQAIAEQDVSAVIAEAHVGGGICSINHPKRNGPPWRYSLELPVDAFEVWQTLWPRHNDESLAHWDRLLQQGRRLTAVGGSDFHGPIDPVTATRRLGWPTTHVRAAGRSAAHVLDGVRAGRVCVSASPDGPRLDLRATAGAARAEMGEVLQGPTGAPVDAEITVVGGRERTLRVIVDGIAIHDTPLTADRQTVRVAVAPRAFVRAEVIGPAAPALLPGDLPAERAAGEWCWALSNPIYL